jgi:transposase-like protein
MSNPEQGISALRLQSLLAVTYKTAWSILHKIRSAMSEATAETPLTGEVVIHDAAYGRPPMYQPFVAHPGETTLLVGASLSEEGTPGQISMQAVPEKYLSQRRIHPEAVINFRREHMEKDATVAECLINRHFHRSDKISMPLVNQARRWFHHTFHGIGKKHLQTYLHEFCCRMNLMLADKPIFESVSRICATTSPHG